MKREIRRLCSLLDDPRGDVKCAAALVLGRLGEGDRSVVAELGKRLEATEDEALAAYLVEALEALGHPDSLPFLLRRLRTDLRLAEPIVRAVAGLGDQAVPAVAASVEEAASGERRALGRILLRIGTVRAVRALVDLVSSEPPAGLDELLSALRQDARSLEESRRRALLENVRKLLRSKPMRADPQRLGAAARLAGLLDLPEAFSLLLSTAGSAKDREVRQAALQAMRGVPRPARHSAQAARTLLGFLSDSDADGVAGPAVAVLEEMELPDSTIEELSALVRSRRPPLRRFALAKLAAFDRRESAEALLEFLSDEDPSIREPAARALATMESARALVLERLLHETRLERAWLLVRILESDPARLDKPAIDKIAERAVRHLDNDNRLYEPVLHLLGRASPEGLRAALHRRAKRKKRSRRFEEAAHSLRLIVRAHADEEEVRFDLAVALVKLSPRPEAREERARDPAIELLTGLLGDGFPVFERLRQETVMTAEELFWLGGHFVERESAERDLGVELLQLVCRKTPRSALARRARELLERFGGL